MEKNRFQALLEDSGYDCNQYMDLSTPEDNGFYVTLSSMKELGEFFARILGELRQINLYGSDSGYYYTSSAQDAFKYMKIRENRTSVDICFLGIDYVGQ